MSLRTRLLLGLVALAAAGLGAMGVVTYRELRDDLIHRFDQQLDSVAHSPLLWRALRGDAPPRRLAFPADAVAELRSPQFPTQHLQTRDDVPKLPEKPKPGRFTISSPHYRGIAWVDDEGNSLVVALSLRDVDHTLHRLFVVELVVATAVLSALAGLAWWVVRLGLRPLEGMGKTAGAIAAGDLSRRVEPADERTEVGRLGVALNEMLHQIETAFAERAESEARLRRFVADASHELRTPLTSIRGYAELFRRGADQRPDDLAKTMSRIEEQSALMGVLVDDLLLLARLDQGRPLERARVDLTQLASDAVDDARAVAPQHEISYTPNGAVVVHGDELRLRQVLANLLHNACTHTPSHTPVHVHVAAENGGALLEVRDEGPGMSADDAAHVFERFWRADPSRARASGGVGLGLAIVAAIAEAHGGRAEIDTAPGRGATFRVHLPRDEAEPTPRGSGPAA